MTEDELILTHLLKCSRRELYLQQLQLTDFQQKQFDSMKRRRQQGEPLQYILGVANFMGFDFKVDSRVLVPRPETELLVEEAVRLFRPYNQIRILDLGTGSGNIPISLAKLMPDCRVVSVDISADALALAKENAEEHGVEDRVQFVQEDMINYLSVETRHASSLQYDLIISNPPYIPDDRILTLPKDVQLEPHLALKGGPDGLRFYRAIIKFSPYLLREGGYLMMEFGDGQENAIRELFSGQEGFAAIQIHQDLAGRDRFVSAQKIS